MIGTVEVEVGPTTVGVTNGFLVGVVLGGGLGLVFPGV